MFGFHFLCITDDIRSAARLFKVVLLLLVFSSFIVARTFTRVVAIVACGTCTCVIYIILQRGNLARQLSLTLL